MLQKIGKRPRVGRAKKKIRRNNWWAFFFLALSRINEVCVREQEKSDQSGKKYKGSKKEKGEFRAAAAGLAEDDTCPVQKDK